MSADESGKNNLTSFPVLISVAVLVLAIASAVVNYRQNNLANLESTLRDTREKLDLATKELSDTKLKAVIDYVYGERNRALRLDQAQKKAASNFDDEKEDLVLALADAKDRITDLEAIAEDMSSELDKKMDELEALKNKRAAKSRKMAAKAALAKAAKAKAAKDAAVKAEAAKAAAAKADAVKAEAAKAEAAKTEAAKAETEKPEAPVETAVVEINQDISMTPLVGSADVDIYQSGLDLESRKRADEAARNIGFKPKYPKLPASMSLTSVSTIFFYDKSYESLAHVLAKELNASIKQTLLIRKGASPYNKNKIIVHLIGK